MRKRTLLIIILSILSIVFFVIIPLRGISEIELRPIFYDDRPIIIVDEQGMGKHNGWVNIPTYDKKDEATHPKVLYFKSGFNGYKYWMVMTPYPFNDASKENPSIVVSNDGETWIEPSGIHNPVSGVPRSQRGDFYYSDPFMLFDKDRFELFFRGTGSYLNDTYDRNGYNYIYHQTSTDGINWTEPKLILDNNAPERYMSISVIKEDNIYKIWYVNYDGKVRYTESPDLINFTRPIDISLFNFNLNVWHGEMQYVDDKYMFIFMIKYKLFYAESLDGINFDSPREINTDLKDIKCKNIHIYKASYVVTDKYIELYIPYRVDSVWKMYYEKMSKEDFYNNLNKR